MPEAKRKRPYQKPKLKVIELAAEESLASGCKLSNFPTTIANGGTCTLPYCAQIGS